MGSDFCISINSMGCKICAGGDFFLEKNRFKVGKCKSTALHKE